MDLFRIAPQNLIATDADFRFAFDQRKTELLRHWQQRQELAAFWNDRLEIDGQHYTHAEYQRALEISDVDFCQLCQHIQIWVARENESRRQENRITRDAIGLRSSEDYDDPADGPRIATIYNGLSGRGQFVPYRKGDPDGSRWIDNQPLYIDWSPPQVNWLFSNSGRSEAGMPVMRNPHLYFTEGITWTRVGNHAAAKARLQPRCVFDSDSVRLTPLQGTIAPFVFLALFNSDVFSYMKMRFFQHTAKWEIGNLRQLPIVMPTRPHHSRLEELAKLCIEAKRAEFSNQPPSNALVARTREISAELRNHAPAYLNPSAQQLLLETPFDCLAVLEQAVNWEAEKLYGVEGKGPFNEF